MYKTRRRIFYGWVIVATAMAGSFAMVTTTTELFSVFIQPLSDDLRWSRTLISGAIAVGTLFCAPASLMIGPIVDRHGARLVVALSALAVGLAFMGMAVARSPLVFYLAVSVARAAGVGTMGLALSTAVANWFVLKRGRAIAISTMGGSASLISMPLVAQLVSQHFSWRTALVVMGVVVWSIAIIPALLFMKRRPEDIGLEPDGSSRPDTSDTLGSYTSSGPAQYQHREADFNWRLKEAVRTPTLWFLIVSGAIFVMVLAGVSLHQTAYLIERGLAPVAAAAALSFFALGTGVSRLVWGFLSERVSVRFCMAAGGIFMVAGVALLLNTRSAPMAFLYAFLVGVGISGSLSLEPVIYANYFGRLHLGAIRGFSSVFRWVTAASGPLIAGIMYDITGDYFRAYLIFLILLVIAAFLVLQATPPKRSMGLG